MELKTRCCRLSVAVLTFFALPIVDAHAQQKPPAEGASGARSPRDEAIARFRRGLELYEEQDFNAALIEFRKAYELSPNFKVLYNVGQVCFQLQDYACALKSFESYLFDAGTELSAERKAEVNREIDKLRSRVAKLEITTNVPGVEITIDDAIIGRTPFPSGVVVSAGKRRLVAMKDGRVTTTRTVDVPGAETVKVDLVLVETQGDVQYVDRPSRMTKYSWLGVGVAGALGVGAAVTGVLAMGASSTLSDTKFVGTSPSSAVESQQSKVKTLAVTTDVLAGLAVVTLATTLILTFTRDMHEDEPKPKVSFGVSPTGGFVAGVF